MTQPQDPTADTSFQGLDQDAVNGALGAYNQAQLAYTNAAAKFDDANQKQQTAQGTAAQVGADSALSNASAQMDSARTALSTASRDYANITAKLAVAEQGKARTATDPQQQQLWANESQRAQSQSDLYSSESDLYAAKTQAQIDAASQRASAALQNAASTAQRVQNSGDLQAAQGLLATARAAQLPALTASTVQLHTAQITLASQRGVAAIAQANKSDAQSAYISGAQTAQAVARGDLSQAEADQINKTGGAKLSDLVAQGVLTSDRAAQIVTNMSKWTVLPYNDSGNPTLVQQQQSTGQIAGVPNPGYKNPYLQPLTDRANAIAGIKQQLASGAFGTGQAAIDTANQLMEGITQQSVLAAQGYTPQQYQQAQMAQAQMGMQGLQDVQNQGTSMANTLLSAARGAATPVTMTPYENAIGMAGGDPVMEAYKAMISQVKPITDKASALAAVGQYAGAKAILQTGQNQSPQLPASPSVSTAATQAAQSPTAAGLAAQQQSAANPIAGAAPPNNVTNPLAAALLSGAGAQGNNSMSGFSTAGLPSQ